MEAHLLAPMLEPEPPRFGHDRVIPRAEETYGLEEGGPGPRGS